MTRRTFLRQAAAGAATGAALAAPAIATAQSASVRWRMASSFPKSLDTIFGATELLVKRVAQITGGRFQISLHGPGEIVPGLQVLDAVQAGTVECGHTTMYYYFGKEPTWAFGTATPFGPNARQFNAWWYHAGGEKIFNEFAGKHGVHTILAGNTGAQMGGWYRKEINSLEDLKGLKMRSSGIAGYTMAKLGIVPQQLAGPDIYPALEKGALDAVEWVGPHDDEKLGFNKVAKYYYAPGWWEGGPALHAIVNPKAWEALSPEFKAAFETACAEALVYMLSRYDALNPIALKRLIGNGAVLKTFPRAVMEAAYKASQEVYAELSAKSADFKRIHEHQAAFLRDEVQWFRVTENAFDDFMASVKR